MPSLVLGFDLVTTAVHCRVPTVVCFLSSVYLGSFPENWDFCWILALLFISGFWSPAFDGVQEGLCAIYVGQFMESVLFNF